MVLVASSLSVAPARAAGDPAARLGLRRGTGACAGLYEFAAAPASDHTCTHGPDLWEGAAAYGAGFEHEGEAPSRIPCYSNGPYVRVIYGYEGDNLLDAAGARARRPLIREAIAWVDEIFRRAASKGDTRHVRWKTTSKCNLVITPFRTDVDDDVFTLRARAISAGKLSSSEKGLMFIDRDDGCWGFGELRRDDRASQTNPNNYGSMAARVQGGCWLDGPQSVVGGFIAAHELLHTLGAVQRSAPNATPYAHCRDESDVMCYVDGPGVTLKQVCENTYPEQIDCRRNDYFNTDPRNGSYLDTHWNTARSRFLARSGPPRWDRLTRPRVRLDGLSDGETVAGTLAVRATASVPGDATVQQVTFEVNGSVLATDTTAPFEATIETDPARGGYPNGTALRVIATARDTFWRAGVRSVRVTVGNPTARLTDPGSYEEVTGDPTWAAVAEAGDGRTIAQVELLANGTTVATDTTAPFGGTFDTAALFEGTNSLVARATDSEGIVRQSATREIVVGRPEATLLFPPPFEQVLASGPVTLAAEAGSPVGVARVDFLVDGTIVGSDGSAPYSIAWDPSGAAQGSHSVVARAVDASGATADSADSTILVTSQAASVQVTAPGDGSTVSGDATLQATVSGASADSVDFYVDGSYAGSSSAPFQVAWDSRNLPNGPHVVWARASLSGGGGADSGGTLVTVGNPQATVTLDGVSQGATVTGTRALEATVTLPAGHAVSSVAFEANGYQMGASFGAPFEVSWDSTRLGDGPAIVRATASVSNGVSFEEYTVEAAVTVDVENLRARVTEPDAGEVVSDPTRLRARAFVDAEATIDWVRFYVDGDFVGRDATSPYAVRFDPRDVARGAHEVRAKLIARDGRARWSGPVSFGVAR